MKNLFSLLCLAALGTLSAQTFDWDAKSPAPHPKEVQLDRQAYDAAFDAAYNERQNGLAGVYNPNANGSRTAYGETYNARELTASHGMLPLGTLVRVTNYDNGRQAMIRINDRGQECQDCLIMLSQASADQLGVNFRSRVSVERTGFSNWNPAPAVAPVVAQPAAPSAYQYQASPAYQAPQPYQAARGGYATTLAPSPSTSVVPTTTGVMSREVATFSRRPTAVTPQPQPNTYQPQVYQSSAPAPVYSAPSQNTTMYQNAGDGRIYPYPNANDYQPPVQQQQLQQQVSPPAPTVPSYQQARGAVATPTAYGSAPTSVAAVPSGDYAIQLAAYNNEGYAQRRVNELQASGMDNVYYRTVSKPDGQVINRVYSGNFASMGEAQVAAKQIQGQFNIAGIVARL